MSVTELQQRTRLFASRLRTLAGALSGDRVGKTLLREAAAIDAKCESAYRAKLADKFAARLRSLQDQIKTSLEWLDIAGESPLITRSLVVELTTEGRALIALSEAIAEGGGVGGVVPPPHPPILGGAERGSVSGVGRYRANWRSIRGTTQPLEAAARDLRRALTPAEQVLWQAPRGRKVGGLRFRCQHPVGLFVLDFYCPASKLVIEVDGAIHDEQSEQDSARTEHLEQYGYSVLRFTNDHILTDLDSVLSAILGAAQNTLDAQRVRRKNLDRTATTELPAS